MMQESPRTYVPAAGKDLFLPLYDIMTKLMGADRARRVLLEQADLRPGQLVLDVGCGTGTFAVLLKRLHPRIEVVGLDPDPKALARARRKAQQSATPVEFVQGFSDALQFPAHSFDHVFSSYMFHHLEADQKEQTLREIGRVLKPGGCLHLLDFAGPDSTDRGLVPRLFHFHDRLKDNTQTRILALMSAAGFDDAKVVGQRKVLFGFSQVVYYRACVGEHS